jgi:GntR family transcriptional regulator/MocR family aminotransferase
MLSIAAGTRATTDVASSLRAGPGNEDAGFMPGIVASDRPTRKVRFHAAAVVQSAVGSAIVSVDWTGIAPALLVALDRDAPTPLGAQLEGELRAAIQAGRLVPGERLPATRRLAAELGISRGLVQDAYEQLRAEGYLVAHVGSATRVAPTRPVPDAVPEPPPPRTRAPIDFAPGVPDLTAFPRQEWSWALREACRTAQTTDLSYDHPRGLAAVRDVLAAYLRRVRAGAVRPEQIVVCAGFAQGANLLLRAAARNGIERVAIEDPGDHVYLSEVIERVGLQPVPVAVDDRGLVVEALAATGARAVIVTPTHQSPTGVALAPERRQALLAWARACDGLVIEDDYDSEFRYEGAPLGLLQGLDPERVASVSTASKSLTPAVRLGWIACPPRLLAGVVDDKRLDDRGSPAIEQLALAALIASGRYDRHLRRMRRTYAARRDALVAALAQHAPDVGVRGLAAGLHLVARLPDGADAEAITAAAARRGVGLHPMSQFRADGAAPAPELVFGYAAHPEPTLRHAIATIADLLRGAAVG